MKKLFSLFIIFLLSVIAFSFSGCTDDSFKANIAFTNSNNSSHSINDISFADGNTKWSNDDGYALGETTEKKEVTTDSGSVECAFADGGGFEVGSVEIDDTNSNNLSLEDGDDRTYTLTVLE